MNRLQIFTNMKKIIYIHIYIQSYVLSREAAVFSDGEMGVFISICT